MLIFFFHTRTINIVIKTFRYRYGPWTKSTYILIWNDGPKAESLFIKKETFPNRGNNARSGFYYNGVNQQNWARHNILNTFNYIIVRKANKHIVRNLDVNKNSLVTDHITSIWLLRSRFIENVVFRDLKSSFILGYSFIYWHWIIYIHDNESRSKYVSMM